MAIPEPTLGNDPDLTLLRGLNSGAFFELCEKSLQSAGYQVQKLDSGKTWPPKCFFAIKSEETQEMAGVACQWESGRNAQVGAESLRSFLTMLQSAGISQAIFMANLDYNPSARQLAQQEGVMLIDSQMILEGLRELPEEDWRPILDRSKSAPGLPTAASVLPQSAGAPSANASAPSPSPTPPSTPAPAAPASPFTSPAPLSPSPVASEGSAGPPLFAAVAEETSASKVAPVMGSQPEKKATPLPSAQLPKSLPKRQERPSSPAPLPPIRKPSGKKSKGLMLVSSLSLLLAGAGAAGWYGWQEGVVQPWLAQAEVWANDAYSKFLADGGSDGQALGTEPMHSMAPGKSALAELDFETQEARADAEKLVRIADAALKADIDFVSLGDGHPESIVSVMERGRKVSDATSLFNGVTFAAPWLREIDTELLVRFLEVEQGRLALRETLREGELPAALELSDGEAVEARQADEPEESPAEKQELRLRRAKEDARSLASMVAAARAAGVEFESLEAQGVDGILESLRSGVMVQDPESPYHGVEFVMPGGLSDESVLAAAAFLSIEDGSVKFRDLPTAR